MHNLLVGVAAQKLNCYYFFTLKKNHGTASLMYKFMYRLNESQNSIIGLLTNPCLSVTRYQSPFWEHWYDCLFYS